MIMIDIPESSIYIKLHRKIYKHLLQNQFAQKNS